MNQSGKAGHHGNDENDIIALVANAIENNDNESQDKLRSVIKETAKELGHDGQVAAFASDQSSYASEIADSKIRNNEVRLSSTYSATGTIGYKKSNDKK